MTEREVVEYETVEKTKTVRVCDSCGSDENQLPDGAGDFQQVHESVDVTSERVLPSERIDKKYVGDKNVARSGTQVYVVGETRDLCPVCYGAVFGTAGETA